MQASDWTDLQRSSERKRLLKGEVRVQSWLETYLPIPCKREAWSEDARSALNYLQSRLSYQVALRRYQRYAVSCLVNRCYCRT